jgi:hypothetical protein
VVQPILPPDIAIVEHLGSNVIGDARGRSKIMGKPEWGMGVEGAKEESRNSSSLPNDFMQKQSECCSLPF